MHNRSLSHPAVQQAKCEYEQCVHKSRLSFDELFRLFLAEKSITEIAQLSGVTKQAMQQLYERRFRPFFEASGRERLRTRTKTRANERERQRARELLSNDKLAPVVEKALALGLPVAAIPCVKKGVPTGGLEPTLLTINGKRCSINHTRACFLPSSRQRRLYSRAGLSFRTLIDVDVTIIHVAVEQFPEHTFVIPSRVLRRAYFSPLRTIEKPIFLPVEPMRTSRARVNFYRYEDAWEYLE
jgi:hypothetical protein